MFRAARLPGQCLVQCQVQRHAANVFFAPARAAPKPARLDRVQHLLVADHFDQRQRRVRQQHREAGAFHKLVQILHVWPRQRDQRLVRGVDGWCGACDRAGAAARIQASRRAAAP
jgi:hypothetical protein